METIVALAIALVVIVVALYLFGRNDKANRSSSPDRVVTVARDPVQAEPEIPPTRTTIYVEILSCELSADSYKQWQSLLSMSLGNATRARDLVRYEKVKNQGASMDMLIVLAIESWRRDLDGRH